METPRIGATHREGGRNLTPTIEPPHIWDGFGSWKHPTFGTTHWERGPNLTSPYNRPTFGTVLGHGYTPNLGRPIGKGVQISHPHTTAPHLGLIREMETPQIWVDPLRRGSKSHTPIEPPHILGPTPTPHAAPQVILLPHLAGVGAVAVLPGAHHVGGDGPRVDAPTPLLRDDGDVGTAEVFGEGDCR